MYRDLPTDDNLYKNLSNNLAEDDTGQAIDMAAEQLADLLWNHWLYIQKQRKNDRLDNLRS